MKLSVLLLSLTMACVEPPATDKAATVQPDGAAIPGAPEPGEQPGPGHVTDATPPPSGASLWTRCGGARPWTGSA